MQPEKVFKHGSCIAAIYVNEIVKDGTVRHVRTVSFAKRYRDPQGNWQTTTTLSVNDLPTAMLTLHKAYEYLTAITPITTREEEEEAGYAAHDLCRENT